MFYRPAPHDQWLEELQPTGLQLNGYPGPVADTGNLRKRTIVRKFLCDQMLRVRERAQEPQMAAEKCMTLDGARHDRLAKSFSCKSLRPADPETALASAATTPQLPQYNRRVVLIEGMSRHTSPAALVASISGGALEKVVFHREKAPLLEAHFLCADHAAKFVHSTSGAELNVHGRPLRVLWPGQNGPSMPLAPYVQDEVDQYGASRVVVMSKPVFHKRKENGPRKRYPDSAENFSRDLNLEAMKWDFVQFGGIVEVCPVISSKLSVSIQFTDIRSAILAVNTLRQKNSLLYFKYKNWHHKYDRDVTNRPCKVR